MIYEAGKSYWITVKGTGERVMAFCLGLAFETSKEVSFQDFHHNIHKASELENIKEILDV